MRSPFDPNPTRARRRAVLIGAVVAAAMSCATTPVPASAAVPGLTRVVSTSALGSPAYHEHQARCPDGTAVLSAGFEWIGGDNDLRLYKVQYSAGQTPSVAFVGASPDPDGIDPLAWFGSAWGIRVVLVCARPLPGHTQVLRVGPWPGDSTEVKTTRATCPSGTAVYGLAGGVHWHPDTPHLVIDENWTPNATLTAGSVTAQEDEAGTPANWRTWAQVVCAAPVPGLERVSASVGGSDAHQHVTATCPPGKRVVGAGGDVFRGHGEVVMTAVAPTPDLTGARVAAREDDTGTDARWYAVAHAVCAYP